jgi:hypothetical protein
VADESKRTAGQTAVRLVLLGACLLAAWSTFDGWSWSFPRLTTTGCEEEALFQIWKFVRGGKVYADPHSIPFSVSYFNWLFFLVYGGAVRILFALFTLDDSALPIITRLLTLGFAGASIGIIYAILGRFRLPGTSGSPLVKLTSSVFLIVSALAGSWLYTARPDMAAITCELAGLWCALRYANAQRTGFLFASVLACYAAWSFKQNFVHLIGGLCVFLALRRQWRELGLVLLVFVGLAGGTLMVGGHAYRHSLIGAQMNCAVSFASSFEIFQRASRLAPQLVVIAAGLGIAVFLFLRGHWPKSSEGDLLAGTTLVALGIGFLGAAKQGADINYFIPASVFGFLWGLNLCTADGERSFTLSGAPSFFRWAILAAFCLAVVMGLRAPARKAVNEIGHLVAGRSETGGNEVVSGIGREIAQLKEHLDELPGPVFVTDRACNLPWVQRKAPHFVYSFLYAADRKAGQPFESDGIGGLIEKGFFETIVVLPRGCACETPGLAPSRCVHISMGHLPLVKEVAGPSIDGGRMTHYRLAFQDGAFSYYRRQPP